MVAPGRARGAADRGGVVRAAAVEHGTAATPRPCKRLGNRRRRLFNEIVPLGCACPNRHVVDASTGAVSAAPGAGSPLRVLELGGGIGAVSTMIQQMLEMLDPSAPHVVVEPNSTLSDGPLLLNRERHGSRFDVVRGVVSASPSVAFGSGNVDPKHPRAWMWGTIDASATRCRDVRGAGLGEVTARLGGKPSVLVADCEGGLIDLLRDFPELLDELVCIYYERDPPGGRAARKRPFVEPLS